LKAGRLLEEGKMNSSQVYIVNSVFGWVLFGLSLAGFIYTTRRVGERWAAWFLLAGGWGFFALAQSLLLAVHDIPLAFLVAFWLSSYIMVIAAITMLFLKLIRLKRAA
jgi:hypothetical protein